MRWCIIFSDTSRLMHLTTVNIVSHRETKLPLPKCSLSLTPTIWPTRREQITILTTKILQSALCFSRQLYKMNKIISDKISLKLDISLFTWDWYYSERRKPRQKMRRIIILLTWWPAAQPRPATTSYARNIIRLASLFSIIIGRACTRYRPLYFEISFI